MNILYAVVFALVMMVIGIAVSSNSSGRQADGQIIAVTENGITCAKNYNWSGQSCWREKE